MDCDQFQPTPMHFVAFQRVSMMGLSYIFTEVLNVRYVSTNLLCVVEILRGQQIRQLMTDAAFSHSAEAKGRRQKNIWPLAEYPSRSQMLEFS